MSFRDQLKADLKVDRYTLTHLADDANITNSYLSRIIKGQYIPSVHVATCLALAATRLTNKTYTPDMFMTITKELHQ